MTTKHDTHDDSTENSYPDAIEKQRDGLEGEVVDTMHVWVEVPDDGRKNGQIHYRRGNDKVDALKRELACSFQPNQVNYAHINDEVTLYYCGTFREFEENADQYEFDFDGVSDVPKELAWAVGMSNIHEIKERASEV